MLFGHGIFLQFELLFFRNQTWVKFICYFWFYILEDGDGLVDDRRWGWSFRFNVVKFLGRWRWTWWLRRRWPGFDDRCRFFLHIFFLLLFLIFLILFFSSFKVKTVDDAKLDNIGKFINIKDIEIFGSFMCILLFNIGFDIAFHVREEILVYPVITKIKNILDGFLHLVDIKGIQCFLLNALYVEDVVYCFFDILSVGLEVDQETLLGLFYLLQVTHCYFIIIYFIFIV